MQAAARYRMGIDVGSTTVKIIILDSNNQIIHKSYIRHLANVQGVLIQELLTLKNLFNHALFNVNITGSAGMGVGERINIPFIQEVIAATEITKNLYSKVRTLIDLGGEDGKIVFFNDYNQADIRMNGNCAGGTGAFIDQMASLLNIEIQELSNLAQTFNKIYPIASRCGVFAKTDVQNLISRNIPTCDIAASILHAVALQIITSLARGCEITPQILCIGGPLTFIPALRESLMSILKLDKADFIVPENGEYFPAWGAAFHRSETETTYTINSMIELLSVSTTTNKDSSLNPLFENEKEYKDWNKTKNIKEIIIRPLSKGETINCFLGIDSGSTTSKIVVVDENEHVVFNYYANNSGNPLDTVSQGLSKFFAEANECGASINILSSAATGYGEDLMKSAFNIEHGIVETIAHLTGAQFVDPDASFILDIGGQDMKSIFINNGTIANIELNEACSAGCGSFLQNFADTLQINLADFSNLACLAQSPCDLGSRCTVFMNSMVKQSLRENAGHDNIAAGLAYAVVKNCLYKVLKISNLKLLGNNIVIQGGTFKNDAVYRALELISTKKVSSTNHPELMGAIGAALYAKKLTLETKSEVKQANKQISFTNNYKTKELICKACTNNCSVLQFTFENGNMSYAGNKCEKVFFNKASDFDKGFNAFDFKNKLLFEQKTKEENIKKGNTIGIPRVLNMFENYPFWQSLFTECGFNVILSPESSNKLYQGGINSIMSDNICFPAKLVHGHIIALAQHPVDKIFYPIVPKEVKEFNSSTDSFNCPVVSGYPEVIDSAIDTFTRYNIPFLKPVINFTTDKILQKTCSKFLSSLNIKKGRIKEAFTKALATREKVKTELYTAQQTILKEAIESGKLTFIVAGRPYHADSLVQQKIGQIISDLGANVLTDDVFRKSEGKGFSTLNIVSQWSYPNRVVQAAMEVSKLPHNVQLIQLNSFGCGPDSFFMDETKEILQAVNKNITVLRIDEIASPGSIRLRLRSLIESLKTVTEQNIRHEQDNELKYQINSMPYKTSKDLNKTILIPWLADFISPFAPVLGELMGLKVKNLPKSNKQAADLGLMYGNNEVCYPSTLILGDIIRTLQSGEYDVRDIVLAITQTGGQCRATNYISQIKHGLNNAGFTNIPIVALSSGETYQNKESDFRLNWKKIAKLAIPIVLYGDALYQMYQKISVREQQEGLARKTFDFYIELGIDAVRAKSKKQLWKLLEQAIEDFNDIAITNKSLEKMGLIGEIFVKFNNYAQADITEWLKAKQIEVSIPPLLDFLLQLFVNSKVNDKNSTAKSSLFEKAMLPALWKYVNKQVQTAECIMQQFKFYEESESIFAKAKNAEEIINLSNQFGEGWLIPAEIAHYARKGINKVICIQPFGCIANHIVAKGIERKIKKKYPQMNILYLDIDGGIAETNLQNRLYFMI